MPLRSRLHPVHAILLAFPIALFSSAFVADITYLNSAEMQWSNLAAWAITGALMFGAPVVLLAGLRFFRNRNGPLARPATLYFGIVAAMWLLGLINAFKHSQDAWSSVGAMGVILSLLCTLFALAAGWLLHSDVAVRETAR